VSIRVRGQTQCQRVLAHGYRVIDSLMSRSLDGGSNGSVQGCIGWIGRDIQMVCVVGSMVRVSRGRVLLGCCVVSAQPEGI